MIKQILLIAPPILVLIGAYATVYIDIEHTRKRNAIGWICIGIAILWGFFFWLFRP